MKKIMLFSVLAVALVAAFFFYRTIWPAPLAHQVFINGNILTMNANNQIVQAVSLRGAYIDAIGSTTEMLQTTSAKTVVHDLAGATMLPGFIDAHGHFPNSALHVISADITSPPVGTITSIAGLVAAIKQRKQTAKEDGWLVGFGYDDTLLAEKRHPTRFELDLVSKRLPVAAIHISGHMAVVNSRALEILNIDAQTADPEGGTIGRLANSREPNGLLQESARQQVFKIFLDIGLVTAYKMMQSASAKYAGVGVTTVQSGGIAPKALEGLALFSKLNVVKQRVIAFPSDHAFGETLFNGTFDPATYTTDKLAVGAVKITADGSIQGYTGYLSKPYFTPYQGDANYAGYPVIKRDDLFKKIAKLQQAGYQVAIHGNGDQSIEDILDAVQYSQKNNPQSDLRTILIHAQMARKDQIDRMKALGVTPSFFSAHTWYWGDRHRDVFIGKERAEAISPAAWTLQAGLRFSSHLDTPVTPMQPLQAVWSMVNRITYGGDVLGEAQRIDTMQALRAVTIDAAWQVFQEDNRGSIEPGKFADLVVLSGDPLKNPLTMRGLKVKRTLIGGVPVYLSD